RTRYRDALVLRLEVCDAVLEVARASHRSALARRPRADLAPASARREVRVRFLVRDTRDATLHPHLALELRPVKRHRGAPVRGQLASLAALDVGIEDEP